MIKTYLNILVIAIIFSSCENDKKVITTSVELDEKTIGKHIERLASDEFLGRKPFTEGEVKTVNYLKNEFELSGIQLDLQLMYEVGLKLANEDYFPKWYDSSEFKAARE